MFSRRSPVEQLPPIQAIPPESNPHQIIQAHSLISQRMRRRGGQPPARLPKGQCRAVASLELEESTVRVGSLDGAQPALGLETTSYLFKLASHVGSLGVVGMSRFHILTEMYQAVEVGLDAPRHDSFLVYGDEDKLAIRKGGGGGAAAYTTGRQLLRPGDASVSFVGVPASGPTLETRMAAGTKIFQNRMHVVSVRGEDETPDTAERHCEPFQEALANGMGNIVGHVAAGKTYGEYRSYVQDSHRTLSVWGYDLRDNGGTVAAPHLLARKPLYERIMAQEFPSAADLRFVPIMPAKR